METVESLVLQAQAPDIPLSQRHTAFAELVTQFQDLAFGYAYAILGDVHLAQDVTQEAFIAAYRNLGHLQNPCAFPAWLRRITLTCCHRQLRGKRVSTVPLEASLNLPSEQSDPSVAVEQRALQDAIRAAVTGLPEQERIAVFLFYLSGYSQHDIAVFLGVPVTTVKKRLQYARQRLQERMIEMARDYLQNQRLSTTKHFVRTIQFLTILEAMATAHRQAAEDLLLYDGMDECMLDTDRQALLSWVAQHGEAEVVDLLLYDGIDINAWDADGRTLLSCAVERGHLDLVVLLLRFGADAQREDASGATPLQRAKDQGHYAIAAVLLEYRGGTEAC